MHVNHGRLTFLRCIPDLDFIRNSREFYYNPDSGDTHDEKTHCGFW